MSASTSGPSGITFSANLDPIVNAINSASAKQATQMDQLMAAIAKGGATPTPTPTVAGGTGGTTTAGGTGGTTTTGGTGGTTTTGGFAWPAPLVANSTINIPAGTFPTTEHIDQTVTIKGAGMRKTLLDGQGGAGSGHRLAWGKGLLHVGAPNVTISDLGLINGGGGDAKSDAEAGCYAEGFNGTLTLLRVAIDKCEDGIFLPDASQGKVDLVVDSCVFGRNGANGLADGRSHDMYVTGQSVLIRKSVFVGNSRGNTVKCRGPKLTLEANYLGRTNGRCVDIPGGTDVTSSGNIYVSMPGNNVQNYLGLYDENDATLGKPGSFTSDGDTFYFSRVIGEHLWIANAATVVKFTNFKVFWIGTKGATPPALVVDGPGAPQGAHPWQTKLDETNRVDAPPPIPADPVA